MSAGIWTATFWISYLLLWTLLVTAVLMQLGLLFHLNSLFSILDRSVHLETNNTRLRIGQKLPTIPLSDHAGNRADLDLGSSHVLLLGIKDSCLPCSKVVRAAESGLFVGIHPGWRPILIVEGGVKDLREFRLWHTVPSRIQVVADTTRGAWRRWEIREVPYAMVIDRHGRVAARVMDPEPELMAEILGQDPDSVGWKTAIALQRSGPSAERKEVMA